MKLGVSMYSYVTAVRDGRLDHVGFVREAARIGAEGVELLDFFSHDPDEEFGPIQDALGETGLVCGVYSVSNDFARSDPGEREAQLGRIRFGIEEARRYGAGVVRVFAGDVKDGLGDDACREWIVAGLAAASDMARDAGLRLALENHGRLAGRSSQVASLIAAVRDRCGHDTLWANPDTGNFLLVDEDPATAVASLAPLAAMAHIKDFVQQEHGRFMSGSGATYEGCVIGRGSVPLAECLRVLKGTPDLTWANVEFEGPGEPKGDVASSIECLYEIIDLSDGS